MIEIHKDVLDLRKILFVVFKDYQACIGIHKFLPDPCDSKTKTVEGRQP